MVWGKISKVVYWCSFITFYSLRNIPCPTFTHGKLPQIITWQFHKQNILPGCNAKIKNPARSKIVQHQSESASHAPPPSKESKDQLLQPKFLKLFQWFIIWMWIVTAISAPQLPPKRIGTEKPRGKEQQFLRHWLRREGGLGGLLIDFFQPIYLAILIADTAYFTLYLQADIASKKITFMKESSNLPSADTRILPEILALHKDVEVKMMDAELMSLKEKLSTLMLLGVL